MPYLRSKRHHELFKKDGSSVWWCFLPNADGGRKLQRSTGQLDESAAYARYLECVRARPTDAVSPSSKKERTLLDALDGRIKWLRAGRKHGDATRKKLSEATIDFYVKKGKPLLHVLGRATLLSAIGHEEIRRYILTRSETAKATSIAKELTALSMAMRLARKDGVNCPVFRDIVPEDFAALYVPKERWLTEAEVDALIADLPMKRAAVVAFIVATSATYPSEVAPVRPAHVNGKTFEVHVPGTKRKTRNRRLRVPSHARKYFTFALKHLGPSGFEPWTNIRGDLHEAAARLSMCVPCRAARVAWARHENGAMKIEKVECAACKRTPRFEPLSPNDLRRTFSQWLYRSGVPKALIGDMMGHVPGSKMVETVYAQTDAISVADLVELALKKAPKGARKRATG